MTVTAWNWLLLDKLVATQSQNVPRNLTSLLGQRSLSQVPTMGQIGPGHTLPSYVFKIRFNVIIPSIHPSLHPSSCMGSLSSRFLTKFCMYFSYTYIQMQIVPLNVYPAQSICIHYLYHITSFVLWQTLEMTFGSQYVWHLVNRLLNTLWSLCSNTANTAHLIISLRT